MATPSTNRRARALVGFRRRWAALIMRTLTVDQRANVGIQRDGRHRQPSMRVMWCRPRSRFHPSPPSPFRHEPAAAGGSPPDDQASIRSPSMTERTPTIRATALSAPDREGDPVSDRTVRGGGVAAIVFVVLTLIPVFSAAQPPMADDPI